MPQPHTAVYTGSFDPVTLGHLHVIERASRLFDKLIIGIGINADKKPLFEPQERVTLLENVTKDFPNVCVEVFSGLAVDFVRSVDANIMVRGIRPLTDTAGEFTMMMANHQLDPGIETVFLMADERFAHISSVTTTSSWPNLFRLRLFPSCEASCGPNSHSRRLPLES